MNQEFQNSIATLIPEIDRCFKGGGLVSGDLGVMMASTGLGKSFWLCHVAKAALIQRKKVMFYTLEMSEDQIGDRLDASWSGIQTRELNDNTDSIRQKISTLGTLHGNDQYLIKNEQNRVIGPGESEGLRLEIQSGNKIWRSQHFYALTNPKAGESNGHFRLEVILNEQDY